MKVKKEVLINRVFNVGNQTNIGKNSRINKDLFSNICCHVYILL